MAESASCRASKEALTGVCAASLTSSIYPAFYSYWNLIASYGSLQSDRKAPHFLTYRPQTTANRP